MRVGFIGLGAMGSRMAGYAGEVWQGGVRHSGGGQENGGSRPRGAQPAV